jgi:hypothetical protein
VGVGTIFRSANIRLSQWFRLVLYVAQREHLPRNADLADLIGCSRRTAISMTQELKEARIWKNGMKDPAMEGQPGPPVIPLALIQRIAHLKLKKPTAADWKRYLESAPARAVHTDVNKEEPPKSRGKTIRIDPNSIAVGLREHSREFGWFTSDSIRVRSGIPKSSHRRFKRLMGSLNLPIANSASPVMKELFEEGKFRSAKHCANFGRSSRTVVIAFWQFAPPWNRPKSNEKITVIAARSNAGDDVFWTNTLAPNDRQCQRLVKQLQTHFGHISNYLTNYRRLARFLPNGAELEILEPDSMLLRSFSRGQKLEGQWRIKQAIARQAASRAAFRK